MMTLRRLVVFALALAAASCDQSDTITEPGQTPVPVSAVVVTPDSVTLTVGQTRSLEARAFAADGTLLQDRGKEWSSDDTTVVVVNPTGVATARAAGVTTVTAKIEGKSGIATVRVQEPFVPVASVQLEPTVKTLYVGEQTQLTAMTFAADGSLLTDREIAWASSRNDIATVDGSGLVEAVAEGVADIIATSEGRSAQSRVTVEVPVQEPVVGSIQVRPAVVVTYAGVDAPLQATLRDENGNVVQATVVWTTSDPSVATVSAGGVVRGLRGGEAVITATAGGKSATVAALFNTTSTYHLAFDREAPSFYWMDMRTGSAAEGLVHAGGIQSVDPSPSPTRSGFAYVYQVQGGAPQIAIQNWSRTTYQFLTDGDQPAWSPDGARIAFRRTEGGRTDIWSIHADGSTSAVSLTAEFPQDVASERPAWSPAGDRIVFAASNARGGSDLWIMNADGSGKRMLANGAEFRYTEPTWHGDRIVFTIRNTLGTSDLHWMYVNGAVIQRLTTLGGGQMPVWSPDGLWIAFVVRDGQTGLGDIYVVRQDGTDVRPLTLRADGPTGGGLNPAWTLHW